MKREKAKEKIQKLKDLGIITDNDIESTIDNEIEKHLEGKLKKKEKNSKSDINIIKKNISLYSIKKIDFENLLFN